VIRTLLFLRPKSGDLSAFLRLYRETGVLAKAREQPGCLEAEMAVPLRTGDPVLVTALWRDEAAYLSWVNDPWRQQSIRDLAPLLTESVAADARGSTYEIALREA
jgi:quinol monooxygenase YgiN